MKIDTDSEEPRRSIAGSILTVVDLNDPGFRMNEWASLTFFFAIFAHKVQVDMIDKAL